MAAQLGAFQRTSLREMYLRLAGDDSELTGFVSSDTLRSVLAEAKVSEFTLKIIIIVINLSIQVAFI